MPPKSNNQKKKEAEAAGKPPKKTKQQENAGKSASQKKAEMQVRGRLIIKSYESRNKKSSINCDAYFQAKRAADREKKSGWWIDWARAEHSLFMNIECVDSYLFVKHICYGT